MSWQEQLNGDSVSWLLEESDPAVRHLALRDLLDRPPDDPELVAARKLAHTTGPIADILARMQPEGYWEKEGLGYGPKYRSTVWSMIMLAQMGASAAQDERIGRACAYVLDHALAPMGCFNSSGTSADTIDCLQGNLSAALVDLGCDDPRLEGAFDWIMRSVTGEGVAPSTDRRAELRYDKSAKSGPGFICAINDNLPCAWGAIKLMVALGRWPAERRTPRMEQVIRQGAEFLLGVDPVTADYPRQPEKPSPKWWKFGFPLFYSADLLQNIEALVGLGYGRDPRLANALALVRQKQDAQGRWALENRYYPDEIGVDLGKKGQPNKWITLRALRVLKAVH